MRALAFALLVACGPRPSSPVERPARSDALYFVLVDRFADGRPDAPGAVDRGDPQAWHGGDLQGLIDHLDDLEELGVAGIWASPITDARTEPIGGWGAFHGYWTTDLGEPEPRLATWAEVDALRAALDARGLGLWLDMVYNHVGYDAPLLTEHPDWFHGRGDIVDWADAEQVVTHDVHGLPDLAQERDEVYAWLLERSLRWVERARPEGFRVDAVRHLHPGFLARLGEDLRARDPDLQLLGEVFEGDPDVLADRMRTDALSAVFDFPLHYAMKDVFCEGRSVGRLASVLDDAPYGGAERLVTFVDNHDLPRIRTACGDDPARIGSALAFWLAARGRPCVTWGTEIGLAGAGEPENRADMRFGESHPMGDALRRGLALRARWPSLVRGETAVLALNGGALVTARILEDEVAVVVVTQGEPVALDVDGVRLGLEPGELDRLGPRPPIGLPEALVRAGADEVWLADGSSGDLRSVPAGTVALARFRGDFRELFQAARAPEPVTFEILASDVPVGPGDRAVLVGGGRALGAWEPARGVEGVVEDGGVRFDVTANQGDVLAYKLVVVRASGEVVWEDRDDRYWLVDDATRVLERWGG